MGGGGQGDFPGARSLLQEVATASGLAPSVSPGSLEVATCHLAAHPWLQVRFLPPAPSPRPSSLDAVRGALSPPSRPPSSGPEQAWRTRAQERSPEGERGCGAALRTTAGQSSPGTGPVRPRASCGPWPQLTARPRRPTPGDPTSRQGGPRPSLETVRKSGLCRRRVSS